MLSKSTCCHVDCSSTERLHVNTRTYPPLLTIGSYSQEFPRRFQKDIVHAATVDCGGTKGPGVSAEAIEHVLRNIGMGHRMSRSEIEEIVSEVGTCRPVTGRHGTTSQCVISADQMLDLISKKSWGGESPMKPSRV